MDTFEASALTCLSVNVITAYNCEPHYKVCGDYFYAIFMKDGI
jgi:hypothetical protein